MVSHEVSGFNCIITNTGLKYLNACPSINIYNSFKVSLFKLQSAQSR